MNAIRYVGTLYSMWFFTSKVNFLDKQFQTRLYLVFMFPSVWANHGDDISIQYSGTPALKGDFVRYVLGLEYINSQEKSVSTCLPVTF